MNLPSTYWFWFISQNFETVGLCFVTELYHRGITDGNLCKLLANITSNDDSKNVVYHSEQLLAFLSNDSNIRSVVKSGQNLWDILLELFITCGSVAAWKSDLHLNTCVLTNLGWHILLFTIHRFSSPAHSILLDCLVRSGTCSQRDSNM